MLIGAVTTNVAIFQGNSSVMMTSYVPMQAAPHFYLGLILFAVGALIGCFVFLRYPGDCQERNAPMRVPFRWSLSAP